MPAFALAAALSACGESPCAHLARAQAQLPAAASGCPGLSFSAFDEKRCERNSAQCSNDDFQAIDTAASCLEQVPACMAGADQEWTAQVHGCAPSVSPACQSAVFQ